MSLKIILMNQNRHLFKKLLGFRILVRIHAQTSTLGPQSSPPPHAPVFLTVRLSQWKTEQTLQMGIYLFLYTAYHYSTNIRMHYKTGNKKY